MFKAVNENEDLQLRPTNADTKPPPKPITCKKKILVDDDELNEFFKSVQMHTRA